MLEKWNSFPIEWTELPPQEPGELPHATHEGRLVIGISSIRVYLLSNGQRVIDADDFEAFLNASVEEVGEEEATDAADDS